MPHISIKMLKGRTDEQKEFACERVAKALVDAIGCSKDHISVSVDDYTAQEWQDVFKEEVSDNNSIVIKPNYDPKELL